MINNDSIVTAYDEHLTLVEWLQKIEKLLANGGLKSTTLTDKGNATFSLTLTFNDDTTITSPDMTLTSVNEALTALTSDISRIDGSIGQLNINFQTLDNSVEDIKDGTTHLFENITDNGGNKRFIEGDITMNTIEGITQTYGKWSLSGTHLMIVIAGNIEASTTISADTELADIIFPTYISNKLIPIYGFILDKKTFSIYGNTGLVLTPFETYLQKVSTHARLVNRVETTSSASGYFRIQYDLLIDNE